MLSIPPMKRLLILLVILACVIVFGPHLNPQFRHMRQVQHHIANIGSSWTAFRTVNSGFEDIRLVACTAGDGTLGAFGQVPTDAHRERLKTFLASTNPPRPIYLVVRVYSPEEPSTNVAR